MSSTKFTVGLPDTAPRKMSGRGHTHTDIFGNNDPPKVITKQGQHPSDAKTVSMEDEKKEVKDLKEDNQEKEKSLQENKTENNASAPFHRVRMPPGGFSSNFW